jgi:hypothetical protein
VLFALLLGKLSVAEVKELFSSLGLTQLPGLAMGFYFSFHAPSPRAQPVRRGAVLDMPADRRETGDQRERGNRRSIRGPRGPRE